MLTKTPLTKDVLHQMVEVIVREADPRRIILFGSRARRQAGAASDVDLLVVKGRPFQSERQRLQEMNQIWQGLFSFRISKDILVYSQDELDKWKDTSNHIVARALREGRVLYERS